jgi:mannose-6-phosphate isomerase
VGIPDVQLLPLNQVEHFYLGGERIAALRGGDRRPGMSSPEEWIASMTTMSSSPAHGLSRLQDGTLLRDAVTADPDGWLGPAHVARFGPSTELLVKLLDAGQRLPVHLHPDREFARRHLSAAHGKTEAWIVLSVEADARVRLGFTESMTRSQVRDLVEARDADALVASLHALKVRPGDAVLVPAGLPHCIDAGVFILELQEPTDFSILLEADGLPLDLDRDGHLGLGFDVALGAVHVDGLKPVDVDALVVRGGGPDPCANLMPPAADRFFRAHRLRAVEVSSTVEAGFAVALVLSGSGRIVSEADAPLEVRRGDVAAVPHAAGSWRLEGSLEALVCRPPAV